MKSIRLGRSGNWVWYARPFSDSDPDVCTCKREAMESYIANRMNGTAADCVSLGDMPKDGTYKQWRPNGSQSGNYHIEYTEGPGDKKWMDARDRNYVFRLERERVLDEKEPKLHDEAPQLYEEVMVARQKATEEAMKKTAEEAKKKVTEEEAKIQELNEKIISVVQPLFGMVNQIEELIRSLNERVQIVENKMTETVQSEIGKLVERVQKLEMHGKNVVNAHNKICDLPLPQKQNTQRSNGMFSEQNNMYANKERIDGRAEAVDVSEIQFM